MVIWKSDNVKWGHFPFVSFDRDNEFYISLTEKSYTDDKYLYYICSIQPLLANLPDIVRWHKKLKIHQYIPEIKKSVPYLKCSTSYVNVCGKRIYISGLTVNGKEIQ